MSATVKEGFMCLKITATSREEIERFLLFIKDKYSQTNSCRKWSKIKYNEVDNQYYLKTYVRCPINLAENEALFTVE